MLDTVFGLPTHALVVHATVVMVPLAALLVALTAISRRVRSWAGYLPLAAAVLALVLVPLSTSTGESLERRVEHNALVEAHTRMADGLLPFVVLLTVAAVGLLYVHLRERDADHVPSRLRPLVRGGQAPRALVAVVLVVAAVGSVGTVVQTARIGHAGAKAAWSDAVQTTPSGGEGDG
ncbi:hypothetical protein GCM10027446_02520 [Angustibacter peucedani]